MTARRPALVRRAAAILALVRSSPRSLMAGTALAATTSKPYSVDITSHAQQAGTTVTLTISSSTRSSPQSIGSANWALPTEFKTVAPPSALKTARLASRAISSCFGSMNVLPDATYTLTFSAIMPCVAGTYSTPVNAKQSNNFSGPPGNDFSPNYPAANLQTNVTGACQLSFGFVAQPSQRRDRRQDHDRHL